jgi:hypothetical protein
MTLPVTIPNTFANATTSIPLANLDANFVAIYDAVNGIGNGAESLANVTITGGNATFTTANVTTLDATNVEVTNIKAKDGSASATIADSTGVFTHSTVTVFPAGSNTAPSITTTGDLNTGIFFPGADRVGITTGGTQRVEVDASGDVGISITPSTWSSSFVAMQVAAGLSLWASKTINSAQAGYISNNVYFDGSARKYINTGGASEYVISAGNHEWYTATSGTAGNNITFTEAMRIDSSGNLLVGITTARANAGDVQVSKGISFPATQSAQSDVNTLDDYEEGTFDVSVTFGGASAGITYNERNFSYVKIGRTVYITGYLLLSNKGSSTGVARITGLPFTAAAGNGSYSAFSLHINSMTFGGFPNAFITPSGSGIELVECTEAGVTSVITNADFANDTGLIISGFYRT